MTRPARFALALVVGITGGLTIAVICAMMLSYGTAALIP